MFGHHRQSGMHRGQGSQRGFGQGFGQGQGRDQRFCGGAAELRVEQESVCGAQAAGACPLCRNHCPLDAPGCPKGSAFAARAAR